MAAGLSVWQKEGKRQRERVIERKNQNRAKDKETERGLKKKQKIVRGREDKQAEIEYKS